VLPAVLVVALYGSSRSLLGDGVYSFSWAGLEARELSCCPGMYGLSGRLGIPLLLTGGQAIAMPGIVHGEQSAI
jgi:hypothetical protein